MRRTYCGAYNKMNRDYYVCPSFFLFTDEHLITRKMVEREAFLANLKHQYHASQKGEHDCSAHNKKNRDYYDYPSLSYFPDEH